MWREAHRRGVCQCTHINIHTHSLCAVPQKGADTRCARQGHTHLRAPGSPPSPAHPPRLALGQEQGLLRARAPPRFLPANVSLLGPPGPWGKGLRNAAGATWGMKVGTACSLPGPVGEFPNRETICGEGWVAGEPPVTSRGVPSPCRHRWAPGGLGAAQLPIRSLRADRFGSPLLCAAWTTRSTREGRSVPGASQADPGPTDYFCLISAGMRQPRRRRRRAGGGGVGRGPSGQP